MGRNGWEERWNWQRELNYTAGLTIKYVPCLTAVAAIGFLRVVPADFRFLYLSIPWTVSGHFWIIVLLASFYFFSEDSSYSPFVGFPSVLTPSVFALTKWVLVTLTSCGRFSLVVVEVCCDVITPKLLVFIYVFVWTSIAWSSGVEVRVLGTRVSVRWFKPWLGNNSVFFFSSSPHGRSRFEKWLFLLRCP